MPPGVGTGGAAPLGNLSSGRPVVDVVLLSKEREPVSASAPVPAQGRFVSVQTFEPVISGHDTLFSFLLPSDTFVHSDPAAVVQLDARLEDSTPLPAWLQFAPATGRFTGNAPREVRELDIRVTARDRFGSEVSTRLRLVFRTTA